MALVHRFRGILGLKKCTSSTKGSKGARTPQVPQVPQVRQAPPVPRLNVPGFRGVENLRQAQISKYRPCGDHLTVYARGGC